MSSAAGVCKQVGEEKWSREEKERVGVGGEAGEIGVCKTTDTLGQQK